MANNVHDALREMIGMHGIAASDAMVMVLKEPLPCTVIEMLERQAARLVEDGFCRHVVFLPNSVDVLIYTTETGVEAVIRRALADGRNGGSA